MHEIAERTGITQRTIFRFFKDKKSLHASLDQYLQSYLQETGAQMQCMEFAQFARNVYSIFDRHEALTMAYLFSPVGQEARSLFRKKLTQAMMVKICTERKLQMTEERKKRLALLTTLVNAKIWYDLRSDFGYSGEQMGETVEWALTTLLQVC